MKAICLSVSALLALAALSVSAQETPATSDAPLKPEDLAAAGLAQFPSVVGGVVPVVNIEGVQPGSEIHVYLPDGTELTGVESCEANQALSWPVYAAGSPNNTVFITIIKRGLRWQKFNYASKLGAQSIPIFPQPDLGYNNPA